MTTVTTMVEHFRETPSLCTKPLNVTVRLGNQMERDVLSLIDRLLGWKFIKTNKQKTHK